VKRILVMTAALLAIASLAWGVETKVSTKGGKPYFEAKDTQTGMVTVVKINHKTRQVWFKNDQGDTLMMTVKPDVKTLDQVKAGDPVKVTYDELFTIHVEPSGAAEATQENMRADAKAGEKPHAKLTQRTKYKAKITAIDAAQGSVTMEGYDGQSFTVWPQHKENINKVKVGDLVVFTYTESVAASVEKTAAK